MFKKSKIIVGAALLAVSVLSFTCHSRLKPSTLAVLPAKP